MDDPDSAQPIIDNRSSPMDIHEPFTPAERIQQLSEVDNVRSLSCPAQPSPPCTQCALPCPVLPTKHRGN